MQLIRTSANHEQVIPKDRHPDRSRRHSLTKAQHCFIVLAILFLDGCGTLGPTQEELAIQAINNSDVASVKNIVPQVPSYKRHRFVRIAIENGDLEMVGVLFELYPTFSDPEELALPIQFAAQAGESEIIQWLLERDAPPTSGLNGAIRVEDKHVRTELVRLFIKRGAKPSGYSIWWTVKNQNLETLKELVAAGADNLNLQHSTQRLKVEQGVGAWQLSTYKSELGPTPLSLAIQDGNESFVAVLLKAGANTEQEFISEPYKILSVSGHSPELFSKMVETRTLRVVGAGPPVIDQDVISTPICFAAKSGEVEIVKLLIDAGANMDATDSRGRTPMNLAIDNGHSEIARLLARD